MPIEQDARTARVIHFYENLSPATLSSLGAIYANDARFKDPFNHVQGLANIERVFRHMFDNVTAPRFEVLSSVTQGNEAWLTWDFIIQRAQSEWRLHGATRLQYTEDGRVMLHRDYWDPAEELYARLPVLGALVRWLTRRLSASA
ncbi:MAG TPA: nuclear transport factor 2 family protein [Aquabacterium sp.]|nr:nuclear transport factor 2 family protein [Aquabacterium sp.]